jgi:hypothetical protein
MFVICRQSIRIKLLLEARCRENKIELSRGIDITSADNDCF